MQLRAEQLITHLQSAGTRGLQPVYTLLGDDPLLQQEAADAVRAAARAAGSDEREVHHVSGAHVDWSSILGSAREQSLFSASKLMELRIPSGKPGKDGSEAIAELCTYVGEGVTLLVMLPRLDSTQLKSAWFSALDQSGVVVRLDPVERAALPAWMARRLAAQGQRVCEGEEGLRTLNFMADRVEGHLLAAHQEITKLGLLYPPGELSAEQVESAVLNVARYDVRQWCEAILSGQAARALRILQGLRAEGETAVGLHWQLSDDLRALLRIRQALSDGQPLSLALSAARVWGPRQRLLEQAIARFNERALSRLMRVAHQCDGVCKGLHQPGWPTDAWDALQRLMLLVLHLTAADARRARGQAQPSAEAGSRASWVLSAS